MDLFCKYAIAVKVGVCHIVSFTIMQVSFFKRVHKYSTSRLPWTAVSFNHVVLTQESHLSVNHRPVTQKLALKMWRESVCFYVCVCVCAAEGHISRPPSAAFKAAR